MKNANKVRTRLFAFSILAFSLQASAQSMCGTGNEGQTVTLTAPVGKVFLSITFASYGTPNGSCGSFTIGACHAANSVSIVQSLLVGNNSASIPATNGTFGDPCVGTGKRLYIEATYGTPVPLRIISFTGIVSGSKDLLRWETTDEMNTLQFDIERSDDAVSFSRGGTIAAKNISGINQYTFIYNTLQAGTHFYRLKMVDIDGKFTYTNIIKLSNHLSEQGLVFPNPVTGLLTLSGLHNDGILEIINLQGSVLRRVHVTTPAVMINIGDYPSAVYILKYIHDRETIFQKIVKQ